MTIKSNEERMYMLSQNMETTWELAQALVKHQQAEISSLRTRMMDMQTTFAAQLAAAQKDAARYRWLIESPDADVVIHFHGVVKDGSVWNTTILEAYIDAAMQPLDAAMEGK